MEELIWIFGAGASVACKLRWDYPPSYHQLCHDSKNETLRAHCISEIKATLAHAQKNPGVTTESHSTLVKKIRAFPSGKWKHRIVTTNWDLLLEREITFRISNTCPVWIVDSHVFHLNGSIEKEEESNVSPLLQKSDFLLPSDLPSRRRKAVESNYIFNSLLWTKKIVVVGISFECSLDKGFLGALSQCEDETRIGEATWVLINKCRSTLEQIKENILKSFRASKVISVHKGYEEWVRGTMDEAF